MDFAYIAFTDDCAFGLDEAGVCQAISAQASASEEGVAKARRCIGAQYVACLDAAAPGLLSKLPEPGTRLLFARTEASGRIILVRSGRLECFVTRDDVAATTELRALEATDAAAALDDLDATDRFWRALPWDRSQTAQPSESGPTSDVVCTVVSTVERRDRVMRAPLRAIRPAAAQGELVPLVPRVRRTGRSA